MDKGCGYVDEGVDKVFHRGARRSKPAYKSPAQRGGDNLYTGYTQKAVDKGGVWITSTNRCSVRQKTCSEAYSPANFLGLGFLRGEPYAIFLLLQVSG